MRANLFASALALAQTIFGLSLLARLIAIVVAFGLLAYFVVRFRIRQEADQREQPQACESNQVGLAWIVIPILIVVTLFWQQGE
jgi:heme/copper-type cytochrome/quinol oxidase subunit 2